MSAQDIKKLRDISGAGLLDCKNALEASNYDMDKAIEWLKEKGIAKAAKKADRIAAEGLAIVKEEGNIAVIAEINSETDFVAKNNQFILLVDKIASALLKAKPQDNDAALKMDVDGSNLEETLISATSTIGEKISFRRFKIIQKTDDQIFGPYIHQGGKIASLTVLEGGSVDAARGIAMHVAAINPRYMSVDEIDQKELDAKLAELTQEAIDSGKPEKIAGNIAQGRLNKELSQDVLTKQEYVKGEGESVEKYLSTINGKIISAIRFGVGDGIEKKEDNFAKEVADQVAQATS